MLSLLSLKDLKETLHLILFQQLKTEGLFLLPLVKPSTITSTRVVKQLFMKTDMIISEYT